MDYYLTTLSDGSTSFVSSAPGDTALRMETYHNGATEVSRVKLDIDQTRYEALCTISHLYDIAYDPTTAAITMTPKTGA